MKIVTAILHVVDRSEPSEKSTFGLSGWHTGILGVSTAAFAPPVYVKVTILNVKLQALVSHLRSRREQNNLT